MSSDAGESITPEGLEALKHELEELEGPARRDIAERIQRARELGDLKENAEYHQAKDDQSHLETKIALLVERLRAAVVTEISTDSATVGFGATVTLVDTENDREQTWKLVGGAEADVTQGKLSIESPVAQAVLGHELDAVVKVETPRGTRHLKIATIK